MSIAARNAILADGAALPYDAEVEYLESTGTQWIATGFSVENTLSSLRVVASLRFTKLSNGEHDIMGSGGGETPTMGRQGSSYFMWAAAGTSWFPVACDTSWHVVSYTFNKPRGRVFELDGVLYHATHHNFFVAGPGVYVFASSPNRYPLECQLAKLAIWQDDTLVRDFIPVRVGTVGYLYDRVSGQLFGNAGTGAFVIGPDASAA